MTSIVLPSPKLNVAFEIVPSGSFPSPVNRTENGAEPVADGLTVSDVQIGNWLGPEGVGVIDALVVPVGVGVIVDAPVVGVGVGLFPPTPPVGVGVRVGVAAPVVGVAVGPVVVPVEHVADCVTVTAPGLVEASTFSVGLSAGARDRTWDLAGSIVTDALPALSGLNLRVATRDGVRTAFATFGPILTMILPVPAPFWISPGLTVVGNTCASGVISNNCRAVGSKLTNKSTIETTFCPGSTLTSTLNSVQAVVVEELGGLKERIEDLAASLWVVCCCLTRKRIIGIIVRRRIRLPTIKYRFFRICIPN